MQNNAILVVNAGSSSIKCSLFAQQTDQLNLVYRNTISGIGTHPLFVAKAADGTMLTKQDLATDANHTAAFGVLFDWLAKRDDGLNLTAIGHRVVHGGTDFTVPIQVDNDVLQRLEALIPLAPLHQPHNLAPIKVLRELKPNLPQVACFDTAFHTTQPDVARTFPIPRYLTEQGIRRYGFHGLSYEYIARSLPAYLSTMPERVIVAHLGNGSSMAALYMGRSVATTMGFTALDGLMMGTRCGAVDPGVLLHLLTTGTSVQEVSNILYHQSGLLGVSGGISNDMADLLASNSKAAAEAIDLFVYRIVREVGSLSAALGGLDALVFTAGIGEHAVPIRAKVCKQLAWLGITLDVVANDVGQGRISTVDSTVSAWVIPTDEEKMIAQHTVELLG